MDVGLFTGRDIPAALDDLYVDKPVTVALAHGDAGIHGRVRDLLGHFDPRRLPRAPSAETSAATAWRRRWPKVGW